MQQGVEIIEHEQALAVGERTGEGHVTFGGFWRQSDHKCDPAARFGSSRDIPQRHQPDPVAPAVAFVLPARRCFSQGGFAHPAHPVDGDTAVVAERLRNGVQFASAPDKWIGCDRTEVGVSATGGGGRSVDRTAALVQAAADALDRSPAGDETSPLPARSGSEAFQDRATAATRR
jgi:hypothetical protein